MLLLGIDLGSSSIKGSVIDGTTGITLARSQFPETEMKIISTNSEWAEQDPELWWEYVQIVIKNLTQKLGKKSIEIGAIGISYQMHGLVMVDSAQKVIHNSIIWCDSRSVNIGDKAFKSIGEDYCLNNLLNSPGNFTASKLRWVQENLPQVYARIDKIMLPGDFISLKLTGTLSTTITGMSEGIFWNFKEKGIDKEVLINYNITDTIIPEFHNSFAIHGTLLKEVARDLGLKENIPVSYKAGDQPNNALSLNVLNPGEIAATAGTSGVIYGVSERIQYDPKSRINTFAHVNHSDSLTRLGILLCINGTGILNSWLHKNISGGKSYEDMNQLASNSPVGSKGLLTFPFGNGSERILEGKNIEGIFKNINYNIHSASDLLRSSQEGIVFSLIYGLKIMKETGISPSAIRAGYSNMFLSPVFTETLVNTSQIPVELYDTDGSIGAARGAGIGTGWYTSPDEAFQSLKKILHKDPEIPFKEEFQSAYQKWEDELTTILKSLD
ncbi:MAG: FGGY family carbohydrate kinase [Cyclobacteriaceae bacterium]|nr:FGGY family carbohydrate kinase [Cyclobacteriaceae bacterium]